MPASRSVAISPGVAMTTREKKTGSAGSAPLSASSLVPAARRSSKACSGFSPPALWCTEATGVPGSSDDVRGAQVLEQGRGEPVHAAGDRGDRGAGRGRRAHGRHGPGQRTVLEHGSAQARGDGVDVKGVRVGRVHAGNHGRDEVFQHRGSHPGAHQRSEGQLALQQFLGDRGDQVRRRAQGAGASHGAAHLFGPRVPGDAQDAGGRQRLGRGFAAALEVQPGAAGGRGDDVVAQPEFGQQVRDRGGAGGEGFGAGVEHQAGDLVGAHAAAELGGSLVDGDGVPARGEFAGRNQAGDAAADDGRTRPGRGLGLGGAVFARAGALQQAHGVRRGIGGHGCTLGLGRRAGFLVRRCGVGGGLLWCV